jgi:immune inhibitor A
LHSHGRGYDIYQYEKISLPALKPTITISRFPAAGSAGVNQYGAHLIHLRSDSPLTVTFTGSQQASLLDAQPRSGDHFWTSYPADNSQMSLTRAFDLSRVTTATLQFWTWYELEEHWDYMYLTLSPDNGRSWYILETEYTTTDNPQGNSFGPAFTGVSGGGATPIWVQETADLSPFTGQEVLIRFEYVTDEAVHKQGLALDDIAIPELGYFDDVETDDGEWQAAGFVRHANILPQTFLARLILLGGQEVQLFPLLLDENQQGEWLLPLTADFNQAVLIIAGNTPVTRQPATFHYTIKQ